MITIERILCPVDFSEFSRHALEQSLALARWYGSEVVALHVFNLPPAAVAISGDAGYVPVDQTAAAEAAQAQRESELERFVASMQPNDVNVRRAVLQGGVIDLILREASALPADLIVMGTHGRTGLERLLLGSVTERVLRRAACPVLTVPRRATGTAGRFKRILCPIDFSAAAARALTFALSLAREADARLTVLHVNELVPDPDSYQYRLLNMPEYHGQVARIAREQLAAAIPKDAGTYCEIEQRVETGKAYKEILRVADERDSDLIVIGVNGRSAADVLLFGSTTQHVVREAWCPVLTIRDAMAPAAGEPRKAMEEIGEAVEPSAV